MDSNATRRRKPANAATSFDTKSSRIRSDDEKEDDEFIGKASKWESLGYVAVAVGVYYFADIHDALLEDGRKWMYVPK